MNQVTILGGSAAGIGTDQGCSGYLVKVEDSTFVLDLGPSTLIELRKHTDFRMLDGIVISHLHMDHVLDLFILRFMLSYNPVEAGRKIPLYLPPNGLAFMAKAAELWATDQDDVAAYFTDVFDMHEYDPKGSITIGDASVSFAETAHVVPCWAMRVSTPEGDLVYTADTGTNVDLAEFARGADVIIADSAAAPDAPAEVKAGIHFDAAAAANLAVRAEIPHLVLSHQWEELDPLKNLQIARGLYQGRITVAQPGLVVSW